MKEARTRDEKMGCLPGSPEEGRFRFDDADEIDRLWGKIRQDSRLISDVLCCTRLRSHIERHIVTNDVTTQLW